MTPETLQFIRQHRTDDVRTLALQARKYPEVDMREAVVQIAGWQVAHEKVPTWAACEGIVYPPHLSMEQCSSEATARYKAETVAGWEQACASDGRTLGSLTDLTGGFGIDCAFLAARFREAYYVERQEVLCEAARHNFPLLGLEHIRVCHADAVAHLQAMSPVDWLFLDPARRDGQGGKVVAMADCEPDVKSLEPLLLSRARRVLVKLSPMLDLTQALHDLRHVAEAHVVALGNECKELLLLLAPEASLPPDEVPVCCVNLLPQGGRQTFRFTRRQEQTCDAPCTDTLRTYLYEPNTAVLKAGAFRSIAYIYKVEKLHPNTHLYTSDRLIPDFPGRTFRITASCGFGKRELKELLGEERRANLTVRNFPATVAELRRRLKLSEGGTRYLFATTVGGEKRLIEGEKVRC